MICLPRHISNPCHFPPTGNVAGADQFPPPLLHHYDALQYTLCNVQIYVARIIRERNIKYPPNLQEHRHFFYSMIFIQPNNHQNKKNVRHIIFKIQV